VNFSSRVVSVCLSIAIFSRLIVAQAPVGSIGGTVYDESGAVVPAAPISITNKETGLIRKVNTGADGIFSASALPAGDYEVKAEVTGFRTLVRDATVAVGGVTTVDLHLQLGAQSDIVTVEAITPQVDYDRHTIDGIVNRQQIQNLPLNGRSFLQLAELEPGVSVSSNALGQYNRAFDVSVLGSNSNLTRITVDGATVRDSVTGGTQQNFSQEVVQEFQVSSVNFDLSTGIGAGGAINIVTRSGSNQFHGSAFFFFRDHNMSAYPALQRNPLDPDPFFARRQSGGWFGGPVKKDRLFFFTSIEHNNQKAVFAPLPSDPLFHSFATLGGSPYIQTTLTERIDWRINSKHNAFVRYSHDGNNSFAPRSANELPSAWVNNTNWADSGVFSLISAFTPLLVNEFRYSMTFWSNRNTLPTATECPDCIGLGGPHIVVDGTGLAFGNQTNTPQSRILRRHIFADNVTRQVGSHRMKFGGEWEYQKGTGTYHIDEPAAITLFSPEEIAQLTPQLLPAFPKTFNTFTDVLKLPLKSFSFGIGDPSQPPPFQFGDADHDNTFHFYWQDSWKIKPSLTMTYGLGWDYESNALNHDLTKPEFLAPIYGANNLGPERHDFRHFSPMLGFAWSPFKDNKTVIRGGAGIYYDTIDLELRLIERSYLSPFGSGYLELGGSSIPNPIPGIPGVPVNTPLSFQAPTFFTGSILTSILPIIRSNVSQQVNFNPNNTNLSVRTIDFAKSGTELITNDFTPDSGQHFSIGVQRQITNDFAITADFVYRHFLHTAIRQDADGNDVDLNYYYRYINGVQSPVIPICNGRNAPECSTGPIGMIISGGRSVYRGLLVRADKRFTHRFQMQFSYALQGQDGINGIYNDYNWFQYWGPQGPRSILNVSGTVELPWKFQLSFISSYTSRLPFQPVIPGVDLTGSGIDGFPLPGMGGSLFNRGLSQSDLATLVSQYNQTYAGKKSPNPNQTFPYVTLPANYGLGRNFNSQDLRLTKLFRWRERYELQAFAEAFNIFNFSNITYDVTSSGGYGSSNNLLNSGFGQPTGRAGGTFGTGGPRAFQLGSRFSF
jgi:hypothetical protein